MPGAIRTTRPAGALLTADCSCFQVDTLTVALGQALARTSLYEVAAPVVAVTVADEAEAFPVLSMALTQ